MLRKIAASAMFVATLGACGKDSPAGPATPIVITTIVEPSSLIQGQFFTARVTATPPEGVTLAWLKLGVTGVMTAIDSIPVTGSGSATITRSYRIPVTAPNGSITVVGMATSTDGLLGRGETNVAVNDDVAPYLSNYGIVGDPAAFQPGDSLRIVLTAGDNAALKYVVVRVTGAFSYTDSVATTSSYINRGVRIKIPATAKLGSGITVTLEAGDGAGNKSTATIGPRPYSDTTAPIVSASVSGRHGASGFAPGDTLSMVLNASDSYKLARVGYRLGAPAGGGDSVTTTGTSYTNLVRVVVPASWVGTSNLTVFAVDSVGNRSAFVAATITVADRVRRAPIFVSIPSAVRDVAFDSKRERVYLAIPGSNAVRVVDAATGALPGDIATVNGPTSIDLSLGLDTLLIAKSSTPFVTAVSLTTGAQSDIRVLPASDGRSVVNLRVMGNNVMLVSVTFAGSGYGGSIAEYNLSSQTTRTRMTVTELVPIARSGNRQRALALVDDSCCPIDGLLYDVISDSWSSRGTVSRFFVKPSADYSGDNFLVWSTRFDRTLSSLGVAAPAEWSGDASAMNSDGLSAFWSTSTGVVQRRFSDGALLGSWDLGAPASLLAVSGDGLTLVATSATQATIIDLW